jgi:integrase
MAMQDQVNATITPKRAPWNKGKLTGAKPPLRPKHVWSIRTKLQIEGRARDLAMFNLAIDSKLRGCDIVAIRVEDVAAGGYTADRATVRQKKTGRPVRFELSEQTRQAVDDYLKATAKRPGEFLFTGRRDPDRNITTRQYARLVSDWFGNSEAIWYAFTATDEGDPDLSTNRQSPGCPAFARAYQDRKHSQVSRDRGR